MKIKIVSELLDSTYRGSLKNAGIYLEISPFRLFDHKKIPGIFQDFPKISAEFQDFPGLSKTLFQIPELSRTFQDWWEP